MKHSLSSNDDSISSNSSTNNNRSRHGRPFAANNENLLAAVNEAVQNIVRVDSIPSSSTSATILPTPTHPITRAALVSILRQSIAICEDSFLPPLASTTTVELQEEEQGSQRDIAPPVTVAESGTEEDSEPVYVEETPAIRLSDDAAVADATDPQYLIPRTKEGMVAEEEQELYYDNPNENKEEWKEEANSISTFLHVADGRPPKIGGGRGSSSSCSETTEDNKKTNHGMNR